MRGSPLRHADRLGWNRRCYRPLRGPVNSFPARRQAWFARRFWQPRRPLSPCRAGLFSSPGRAARGKKRPPVLLFVVVRELRKGRLNSIAPAGARTTTGLVSFVTPGLRPGLEFKRASGTGQERPSSIAPPPEKGVTPTGLAACQQRVRRSADAHVASQAGYGAAGQVECFRTAHLLAEKDLRRRLGDSRICLCWSDGRKPVVCALRPRLSTPTMARTGLSLSATSAYTSLDGLAVATR